MGLGKGRVHTPSRVGETNDKNRGFPWARGANSERVQVSKRAGNVHKRPGVNGLPSKNLQSRH